MMMDAKNGATAKVRSMEQCLVVTMKNVQLAGFILIVSKFKISLVEIGIVQTVGRTCKHSRCSGDRVNIYQASCMYVCISVVLVNYNFN